MDCSFGLLKPDCYRRGLTNSVFKIIRKSGLYVVVKKKLILTREQVEKLYPTCMPEPYFDDYAKFLQSYPVTAFVVAGNYAIDRLNELVGSTIPSQARSMTIRGMFGTDIAQNIVHSSIDLARFVSEASLILNWG